MSEHFLSNIRTSDMAPSEIRDAIWSKKLQVCPFKSLDERQLDEILTGLLYRGASQKHPAEPRCVSIINLGIDDHGVPAVQIELTTKTGAAITQAMLCTYCELYGWDCSQDHNLNYYDVLQDDPIWNKGILEELLDGED